MLEISALSVIAIALLWIPFVVLAILQVVTRHSWPLWLRGWLLTVIIAIGYSVPFLDVTFNTIKFRSACEVAGVHIYRTVYASGVYTNVLGPSVVAHGEYQFIEQPDGNSTIRYESIGGDIRKTITQGRGEARYELIGGDWELDSKLGVRRLSTTMSDRVSKQQIANRLMFAPVHGWVDRLVYVGLFGGALSECRGSKSSKDDFYFYRKAVLNSDINRPEEGGVSK